jgi:hypothetical protein
MHHCPCLVFVTRTGKPLAARNVRRDFRKVVDAAGLAGKQWAPRELRHSFVSLLSDARVPIESISLLVGHQPTMVTETIYRKQLRPVIEGGAEVMDRILPAWPPVSLSNSVSNSGAQLEGPRSTFALVGAGGFEPPAPRL